LAAELAAAEPNASPAEIAAAIAEAKNVQSSKTAPTAAITEPKPTKAAEKTVEKPRPISADIKPVKPAQSKKEPEKKVVEPLAAVPQSLASTKAIADAEYKPKETAE